MAGIINKKRVAPASKIAGAVTPVTLLSAIQHQRHPLNVKWLEKLILISALSNELT